MIIVSKKLDRRTLDKIYNNIRLADYGRKNVYKKKEKEYCSKFPFSFQQCFMLVILTM